MRSLGFWPWATRFLIRYAVPISLLGLISGGVCALLTVKLFQNLRPDMEELLPLSSRSVVDLTLVSNRLQSIDNLAVLVFTESSEAGKQFVTVLAKRLESAPKNLVASVEYRIDRELASFKQRQLLYLELRDLRRIHRYLNARIQFETTIRNPLTIFSGVDLPEPTLDLSVIRAKYQNRVSTYAGFPEGYYSTPDGKKRVILAYAPSEGGIDTLKALKAYVEREVRSLDPHRFSPDLKIHYTGGVQNRIEEQAALVADLGLSTMIVAVLVSLSLLLYFKNVWATISLTASLFVGTLWTFGVTYFTIGYLNANSAFLASIIMGNGINFPIILLARYRTEMKLGVSHEQGLENSLSHTAKATWTAALAAALAYGSLTLTEFRGFRQFGIIGFVGMVLCWLTGFVLLPTFLTIFNRWQPLNWGQDKALGLAIRLGNLIVDQIGIHARALCVVALSFTVVSVMTLSQFDRDKIIETDLTKLRSKESMERGSGYLSHYVDEIFQRYLSPVVILPINREDVMPIAAKLKALKLDPHYSKLIASVQTIEDFVPKDQAEKIRLIRSMNQTLTPRIRAKLALADQVLASQLLTREALNPVVEKDLPPMLLSKLQEKDGTIGNLIVVEPPVTKELRVGQNLLDYIHILRRTADSVRPGTPVAGGLAISADMIEAIGRDGPKATLFALLSVVLLVVVLFRTPRLVITILFSLFLGIIWMGGVVVGTGLKINFLNFIAMPITFGIGVDYGVNMFQRFREEGTASMLRVVRETGGAVALCSWTTIIGFGSLLIAQNQAFVSFGKLAVLGELTCVVAATIALPSLLIFLSQRRESRGHGHGSGKPASNAV